MQEVIAWAKLNSALKERLVRAAAHCLSSHSLESTIFYGWWGTDGSQCCPRTLQWWGWKQSLKKKKLPLSWWLLLWLHSNYTCTAYNETDIFGQSEHWNRSFGSIFSLFIYSFFHVSLLNCMGSQVVWWIFHQSLHFSSLDLTNYPSSGLIYWQVGF